MTTVFERFADGPQPTSVTISDEGSAKKTELAYTTQDGVSLLTEVKEYPNTGETSYRVTKTVYNNDPNYSSRHIFGLPQTVSVYRGSDTTNPIAVTQFAYDEPAYFDPASFSAFQHDAANYGGHFIGRANLTSVMQQEIPGGGSRAISRVKYDKTGQPTEAYDVANNVTRFYYEDNFLPGQSVEQTHALLTRTQDSDGYWSGVRYDCNTGLPAESHHITGQTGDGVQENTVSYEYDSFDRPSAINRPDGGSTTYSYWDNWLAVAEYTLIDASQYYYRYTANTGDGRSRWQGGDHPDGTGDKFWIEKYEFDAGGRATRVCNVTAVTSDGTPIDENATEGYYYTTIIFDALDRQTEIQHPDQNKVFYTYEGCGCAGGWTVTSRDERGRKRRQIYDFLGRLCRGQELNSSDEVYSQARCFYDERDLLLRIEHSDGDEARHQDRTFEVDGYGRLWKETSPEKGLVEYSYKLNDQLASVTDARGIIVTYDYNGRGLLTQVLYSDETPDVFYEYGEYGERLWMQEKDLNGNEIGRTDYGYDQYKRLRSETRGINEFPGVFRVEYEYNLAGLPTKLIYTVNGLIRQVNYAYNLAGALRSVGTDLITGDATNNIASGYDYLASAALMSVNYGNGRKLSLGYDLKRSQLNSLQLKRTNDTDPILSLTYDYYTGGGGSDGNNGRIRHSDDLINGLFTADFSYDEYNRLTGYGPNNQRSYSFDPWGNLLGVSSSTGGGEEPNYSLSYETSATGAPLNNRIGNAGYSYDNAGNTTGDGIQAFTFDGANRLKTAGGQNSSYDYDGDGRRVKQSNSSGTIYYLWSSLLGEPVIELDGGGGMYRIYLYSPGGQLMGLQGNDGVFYWVHGDQLGSARMLTDTSGVEAYRAAFDPHGQVLEEIPPGNYINSHKFTGYERDWATGIDNAKSRAVITSEGGS